ncbi:MAG: hypothetical protein GX893_01930 [Firmicutes bacterium]|nr:hypothetical protein [Bacillota bacterium]
MSNKLPSKVYWAYGFQEFAMGFMTTMGVQYFSYFLTDVAFVAPAIVATILLVGRIVDTVDVPIIGVLVEKSNLPWGKYRSWLFITPPLIMLFNVLMFTNMDISMTIKPIILAACYILSYVFVNFAFTARLSLLPTFTNDQNERAILSAKRGQGAALGQIVRGAIVVPLVSLLGAGNEARGYQLTVALFGLMTILGLYYLAYLAKDYDKPGVTTGKQTVSVRDMIASVATNKPLLLLLLADTTRLAAGNILTGLGMYFFRYVVGDLALWSVYLPASFVGGFLGNTVSQYISVSTDKKTTYRLGILVWFAGMLSVFLFAGSNPALFIAFVAIAQFGNGLCNAGVSAFYSDTADYGEWKTGKSVRAVNMGLTIFPIKLGLTIGGSIASFGLVFIGFEAGTTNPAVISGIRAMIGILPAVVSLLSLVFMTLYPLTRERMNTIQEELRQRKSAAPETV